MEDYDDDEDRPRSDLECASRSPTPRFIVDRQGAFRWPPIRIGEDGVERDENSNENPDPGTENFTLKRPLTQTLSDTPRVLGWLQVR